MKNLFTRKVKSHLKRRLRKIATRAIKKSVALNTPLFNIFFMCFLYKENEGEEEYEEEENG